MKKTLLRVMIRNNLFSSINTIIFTREFNMKFRLVIMCSVVALLSIGLLTGNTNVAAQTASTKAQNPGEAYLAANKLLPGVTTTADGLQYKVIKEGGGLRPTDSDVVTVNYSGKLIDGTVFDSSYDRGQPATFPVDGVIAGWTEALKLMKVGAIYELVIPAKLAYGKAGAPPAIGPDQTLLFKVELIAIDK
jgi:FKBP-type peptidyl-prolyl cis-trans isomerase FklB